MGRYTLFIALTFFVFSPFQSVLSQSTPGWQWAKFAGGTGLDEAELPAVDPSGNVFICGKFSDTAWFGQTYLVSKGALDMYLAKYDSSGNFLWAQHAGSAMNAEGLSIASDHLGNVGVTGYYKDSLKFTTLTLPGNGSKECLFVAMFDSTGALLWAYHATGGNIRGKGIEFDPWGEVLVTGHYEDSLVAGSSVLPCAGLQNAFLMKISSAGQLQWATYAGGPYNAWASSVGVDPQGNSYITGAFKDTAWFGSLPVVTYGLNDVFLGKCDPAGNWIWATHGGGSSDDYGNGIEVDAYGFIAVTGSFFQTVNFPPAPPITTIGGKDGFVVYYNPDGNALWANGFGSAADDKGIGVSTDAVGNVYVTGFVKGLASFGPIQKSSAGNDDMCIAKYNRTGQILWAELAGGTANDYGKGIQVDMQGVAYVAGYFEGTAQFGNTTLISKGSRESYVAKYHDGTPIIYLQPQGQNHCIGDTFMLTIAAIGNGLTYAWYKDGTLIQNQIADTYTIYCPDTLPTGKYHCVVANLTGFAISDTALVNVYNYSDLSLGYDTIYLSAMDYLELDAGGGGDLHFHWSTGDTTQAIAYYGWEMYQHFSALQGVVWVAVTNLGGCSTLDSVWIFISLSANGQETAAPDVTLMPNPASSEVRISCSEPIVNVEIFSLTGQRLVAVFTGRSDGIRELTIPVEHVPAGMYSVRIQTPKGILVRRLSKVL
jgi:hypothetical protein